MRKPLTELQISKRLETLPQWKLSSGASICRDIPFSDFKSGLLFVNRVGELAEELNHHPDVFLTWGNVRLTLTTHSARALTELDFEMAALIERELEERKIETCNS